MSDLTPEVRAEMARQGISGAELARRTGHAQQSVSRALLRGPLDPRSLWPDILDALGLELHIRPKTRPDQPSESDNTTP